VEGGRDPVELAASVLRRSDRSAQEVDERLERAGVDEAQRAEALDTLVRLGYVDDARLAVRRAETLAERGFGDAAIRHDLARRGISSDEIAAALAALAPERERATARMARDGATPRMARRLAAKGFSAEAIDAALEEFAAGAGENV
jgi:SOS response regulatory protein OraA/RecX